MNEGDKFEIMLSDRLNESADDMDDSTGYDPTRPLDSRANRYEYIMHGKIFKYAEEKARAYVHCIRFQLQHCNSSLLLTYNFIFILTQGCVHFLRRTLNGTQG